MQKKLDIPHDSQVSVVAHAESNHSSELAESVVCLNEVSEHAYSWLSSPVLGIKKPLPKEGLVAEIRCLSIALSPCND